MPLLSLTRQQLEQRLTLNEERTADELRAAGFDVMMAANAQSARAFVHLYPPVAIVARQDDGREIHHKHPQIPTVWCQLMSAANFRRSQPAIKLVVEKQLHSKWCGLPGPLANGSSATQTQRRTRSKQMQSQGERWLFDGHTYLLNVQKRRVSKMIQT